MNFSAIVDVAPNVHYTCFVWDMGKFRQWFPKNYIKGVTALDQAGTQLRALRADVLDKHVHSIEPTAYNYMNVYLY